MELELLINEVELETKDTQLNKLFDNYIVQIFSPQFCKKIESLLRDKIKLEETVDKNNNVVAWTQGTTIYVNSPVFYSKNRSKAILFIMHEFIHVLQNSKSFFIMSKFNDIKELENALYTLVSNNLTKSYAQFLTGKNQDLHSSGKDEVLTYMMNNSIDWSAVKPGTKEKYKALLEQSGIFNLNTPFWTKRI